MANLNFPPGQYEIKGRTRFGVEGIEKSKAIALEAKVIFTVIELFI